eukprot:SAG25_NODE_255_length_10943_cov_46.952047_8_plen_124_part_00
MPAPSAKAPQQFTITRLVLVPRRCRLCLCIRRRRQPHVAEIERTERARGCRTGEACLERGGVHPMAATKVEHPQPSSRHREQRLQPWGRDTAAALAQSITAELNPHIERRCCQHPPRGSAACQ